MKYFVSPFFLHSFHSCKLQHILLIHQGFKVILEVRGCGEEVQVMDLLWKQSFDLFYFPRTNTKNRIYKKVYTIYGNAHLIWNIFFIQGFA